MPDDVVYASKVDIFSVLTINSAISIEIKTKKTFVLIKSRPDIIQWMGYRDSMLTIRRLFLLCLCLNFVG